MGLRGINAKPLSERALDPSRGNPWDAPGLARAERVIALPPRSYDHSGTKRLYQAAAAPLAAGVH